ncbi:MAG: hypothetical protein DHS20C01_07940 [marine bacterium B5-7]|nr:MAG: hypothetical protein DHS20C01_07940 [marine bacterium B5-7]
MRRFLKPLSALLLLAYVIDLLLKKFFLNGFYGAYAFPEVASYLCLFFSVGLFLLSIIRVEDENDDEET